MKLFSSFDERKPLISEEISAFRYGRLPYKNIKYTSLHARMTSKKF